MMSWPRDAEVVHHRVVAVRIVGPAVALVAAGKLVVVGAGGAGVGGGGHGRAV